MIAPDTHSVTPPHIDLYHWYWQIHPYGNGTSHALIRGGDQVKTRQTEEENESLGDFTFLLTVPILSSHWHWLQPVTNSNVIMSSNSADQRLMRRFGIELVSRRQWGTLWHGKCKNKPGLSITAFDTWHDATAVSCQQAGKTHIHTQICSELSIRLSWVSLWALVSCDSSFRLCQAVSCTYLSRLTD